MKSLDELKRLSKDVFKSNPKADKLLATSDGQFFLEKNKNAAEFHAKKNGGLKIHEFTKEGKPVEDESKAESEAKAEQEAAAKKQAESEAKAEQEAAAKKQAESEAKAEQEAAAKKQAEVKAGKGKATK